LAPESGSEEDALLGACSRSSRGWDPVGAPERAGDIGIAEAGVINCQTAGSLSTYR
jgi:hypothetical protein